MKTLTRVQIENIFKSRVNSLLFLYALLVGSCSTQPHEGSINLRQDNPIPLAEMFSDVRLVTLETTSESLISQIRQIAYHQSRFYILDSQQQMIFCFDENGKFIFRIAAQGNGPGEYNYLTDINVDAQKGQLMLLDPAVARVHYYDLDGNFLQTVRIITEKVMGLNRTFAINDSILLITSITYEQLVFYNLNKAQVDSAYYSWDVQSTLEGFTPMRNVYQLEGSTFVLPGLSQEMMDVSDIRPVPYFAWCFGTDNNSDEQISRLLQEIRALEPMSGRLMHPMQGVGQGKILNHHIMGVSETPRFRIALVEHNNQLKHVVIDKMEDKTHVFHTFKEGVVLPGSFYLKHDFAIDFYPGMHHNPVSEERRERFKSYYPGFPDELFDRQSSSFKPEILSDADQKIFNNHDEMDENPMLIVYRFRE